MLKINNPSGSFKPSFPMPPPGKYTSIVTSVDPAPGYQYGNAISVKYRLNGSAGTYSYHETFRIRGRLSDREEEFSGYLDELGMEYYEDFVGTEEQVVLARVSTNRGTFTNIVERELVSLPNQEGEDDVEN